MCILHYNLFSGHFQWEAVVKEEKWKSDCCGVMRRRSETWKRAKATAAAAWRGSRKQAKTRIRPPPQRGEAVGNTDAFHKAEIVV